LALLGSVAIPARQTWRITQLLRESTQVLAPARLLVEKLQAGLAREYVAVQGYALSGDGAQLAAYRASADEDERWLAAIERLAPQFDAGAADRARALRTRIAGWRQLNGSLVAEGASRDKVVAALGEEQARYDASLRAIALLSADLVADAAARDDQVRSLEHLSIVSNAALVLAALVAMSGVANLTIKERKLTAALRRRVDEEAALREAAESLGSAYTVDEVNQRIVDAALEVVAGRGAFVELIEDAPPDGPNVVVRAISGSGVPPLETTCALAGSYTERVAIRGEPFVLEDLSDLGLSGAIQAIAGAGSAIVVPLGSSAKPTGALFVVSSATGHFRDGDVARAGIFGHLAALAYEKVGLLEEAHARRRVLERVIQSRSRLMRGFSHDVKNPIGAADGFAELLSLGVYGELSAEQRGSIDRMRRSIRTALSLIDDLHELARAETGNLALAREPVDLGALARSLGEEYHAAAHGHGLSLTVEAEGGIPAVESDRARVRQIVANLLSNAIKYTPRGSITVRARRQAGGPAGDECDGAVLEVSDTGVGIAAEKQGYIFEEFSRLGTGDAAGAGLGLAISNLLAQRLGGRILVASEVGRGSTFTLWLPVRRDESPA
jgi:signal transduction histidine kinase